MTYDGKTNLLLHVSEFSIGLAHLYSHLGCKCCLTLPPEYVSKSPILKTQMVTRSLESSAGQALLYHLAVASAVH